MSFVPAPQQANAAVPPTNNNGLTTLTSSAATAAPAAVPLTDQDIIHKLRTFDVYWVEKKALMYKDGYAKVSNEVIILFSF
jgi:ATP-dependent RNA helicase DDX60